jgi:hypothetical protein
MCKQRNNTSVIEGILNTFKGAKVISVTIDKKRIEKGMKPESLAKAINKTGDNCYVTDSGNIQMLEKVTCPYCDKPSKMAKGDEVYPDRKDLSDLWFWLCKPCEAWVGCHKQRGRKALGRLANKELREAKRRAHLAFDPLWEKKIKKTRCSKSVARKAGYKWLAGALQIDVKKCHIGEFNIKQCEAVVKICWKIRSRWND